METTVGSAALTQPSALAVRPGGVKSVGRGAWHFCRRKPLGAFGALIVIAMLFVALFVDGAVFGSDQPWLAPDGFNNQHIRNVNQGISWGHPMGTDDLGRDIFSRILYGARISAVIGYASVAIVVLLSLTIGTISGFFGGWIDTIVQRIVDIILSIPAIVLLVFSISVFA
jgi:ABC-type dipeptide/oligopeptide/nickel transport system permease subunit